MKLFPLYKSLRFLFVMLVGLVVVHPLRSQSPPRFPPLSNEEALKHLPREKPTLPIWARILAPSLPKTTASMLELDYVHRVKNPLGAILCGKIRWVAADANSCTYSRQRAEADLKRAGLSEADIKALAGDRRNLPEAERLALDLARKISRAAHQVTDDEMAALLKHFGPEKVVAIVHTLAHANFQDRIFLALGIESEDGGHLPPLDFRIDPEKKDKIVAPARPPWTESQAAKATVPKAQPEWLDHRFDDVQKLLASQKSRQSRIPLPDPDMLSKLPPESRERTMRIVWSRVSMGYQPLLTRAWFDCMGTFQKEANLDQVFANTFFWVTTRSNDCFY
jgi:hypothetical protein